MDWTKAKNILIIALVITNLVLIYSYAIKRGPDGGGEEQALINYLESKQIFVDTEMPGRVGKMPVLSVEHDQEDEILVKSVLERQKALPKKGMHTKNLKAAADKFLADCGFMNENVVSDEVSLKDGSGFVRYKNKVEDFYLEDSYMECTFEEGKLVSIDRYWLNPVEFGSQKQTIIPAGAALMEFAGVNKQKSEEGEAFHVTGIEIVYWLDVNAFETQAAVSDTALPAWKITYDGGKIYHISAFE